ncbi:hypothetical protein PGT21_017817 [Puccinia graminis f. sp. tritici]|uniref:Uncharacterized protein n=1 Tax=Puccinia graminis f. sp. tritici TaxID=56615 RepID=A0A5B0Q2U0_PUCGR|nr:hypothetical protein PGT21_017817 [Puccinia graminis f. sp. tritici]KAA1124657.1 hypothetical protein PGTUg99_027040 [Puccinia graminis f. sp. tritici]
MFLTAFLTLDDSELAFRRRYWGTKVGWPSTCESLQAIKKQVNKTQKGKARWREFIQREVRTFFEPVDTYLHWSLTWENNTQAVEALNNENPPSGNYPVGSFQSSQTVEPSYFTHDAACAREELISQVHMPFLFNILLETLQHSNEVRSKDPDDNLPSETIRHDPTEQEILDLEGIEYEPDPVTPCRSK